MNLLNTMGQPNTIGTGLKPNASGDYIAGRWFH
jgi:hypothetical protein